MTFTDKHAANEALENGAAVTALSLEEQKNLAENLKGPAQGENATQALMDLYGVTYGSYDEDALLMFSQLEVMDFQTDSGGILLRHKGNENYGYEVTPHSVGLTGVDFDGPLLEDDLVPLLEGAELAKTLPGVAAEGLVCTNSLKGLLSAEAIGLKVDNREEILAATSPEELAKMDEYAERLKNAYAELKGQPALDKEVGMTAAADAGANASGQDVAQQDAPMVKSTVVVAPSI